MNWFFLIYFIIIEKIKKNIGLFFEWLKSPLFTSLKHDKKNSLATKANSIFRRFTLAKILSFNNKKANSMFWDHF